MTCNQPIQYFLLTSSLFDFVEKYIFPDSTVFYFIYAPSNFRHSGITEKLHTGEHKFNRQLFDQKIRLLRLTRIFTHWFFGWLQLCRWAVNTCKANTILKMSSRLVASTWSVWSTVTFRFICLPGCRRRRLSGLSSRVISISSARKIVCKHHRMYF